MSGWIGAQLLHTSGLGGICACGIKTLISQTKQCLIVNARGSKGISKCTVVSPQFLSGYEYSIIQNSSSDLHVSVIRYMIVIQFHCSMNGIILNVVICY
jgi:hypothetical protein